MKYIIPIIGGIFIIILVICLVKKKGIIMDKGLKLKTRSCSRTHESKQYADSVIQQLHRDLEEIYPDISTILKLKFAPLECCDLEDSVTEDKKRVYICVKNKQGRYYNYNKLVQVAVHELAHVLSKTIDPEHKSPEFNNNYTMLMKRAKELGLIDVDRLDERL